MSQDMLEQLRAIDPAVLTQIVRQDQGSADVEIMDWTVDRLSTKGVSNPDGLFRFSGHGRVGQATNPWSVVLKIAYKPDEQQDPRDLWYWKRELLVAQSGLLERLPGPVVAPRIYATVEYEDKGWLWMEHIVGTANPRWTLEQYAFAAREIGHFNGAYLTGVSLPDAPWLCTGHCRSFIVGGERALPDRGLGNRFVREAFSEAVRHRVERLWAEKARLLAVLDEAPQVFSHFDFQRRNLFMRKRDNGRDEIVAVDWEWAGRGALGGDLFSLVGSTALLFEVEPERVPELEAVAADAYLAGLRDAGWQGDPDIVHLGYTAWFALWLGMGGPLFTALWTADESREWAVQQFGRGPAACAAGWAALCELALDRADEAVQLMRRLGLG